MICRLSLVSAYLNVGDVVLSLRLSVVSCVARLDDDPFDLADEGRKDEEEEEADDLWWVNDRFA